MWGADETVRVRRGSTETCREEAADVTGAGDGGGLGSGGIGEKLWNCANIKAQRSEVANPRSCSWSGRVRV